MYYFQSKHCDKYGHTSIQSVCLILKGEVIQIEAVNDTGVLNNQEFNYLCDYEYTR